MSSSSSSAAAAQERDAAACDLLVALCASAANSYRQDTALRPFPPAYAAGPHTHPRERDVVGLRGALARLPVLPARSDALQALGEAEQSLLHWITAPAGERVRRASVERTVRARLAAVSTGSKGGSARRAEEGEADGREGRLF